LDDLMGEEARESDVVCAASRFWLARVWEPLEKKDESADGLDGHQRGRVEGIEIVDNKRYAERLEKLAATRLQGESSTTADRVKHVKKVSANARKDARIRLGQLPAAGIILAGHYWVLGQSEL
jgi:hypothetical protein